MRPPPIAAVVSDEATFETYATTTGYLRLVMRPHGVEQGDEREVAWDLTFAEAEGLVTLLNETLYVDADIEEGLSPWRLSNGGSCE